MKTVKKTKEKPAKDLKHKREKVVVEKKFVDPNTNKETQAR